ncbi:histidine kinase [Paraglaciecola sp. Hal342]
MLEFSRGYDYYVKVLAIIPAIYFSLRYGVIGAMCSVLFLCAMTYMAALLVNGPTLENQFYMIAMSICCFFLGSAVSEQRTTQMALKTLNADLNNSNTELKKSLTQNRLLTGKLIDSQEDERKRLSMDLHDDFGQKISEIKINASMLKRKLPSGLEYANSLIGTADNLYASLKSSIGGLSPSGLDEFGLSEILRTGEVVKLVESQEINYIVNMVGSDSASVNDSVLICIASTKSLLIIHLNIARQNELTFSSNVVLLIYTWRSLTMALASTCTRSKKDSA